MSASLTPSKRPHERTLTEPNGKGKWQKSTGSYSHNQPLKLSPNGAVFRVLCPASKIGSVIGKAGSIISEIRQETGAKVKVEEIVSGCEERVIVITSSEKGNDINAEQSKDGSEEANVDEKHDEPKEQRNSEDMGSLPVEHLKSEYEAPPAQKALLLTFDRMVEGEPDTDGGDEEGNKSLSCILRLLVLSTQVGCLLGKGGSVIKQMSSESGAQIRILPRDKLPPCASASDELVQITGEVDAVRKALQSVSQQLLENSPRDQDSSTIPTGSSNQSYGRLEGPPPNRSFISQGAPYADGPHDVADYHSAGPPLIPKFHDGGFPGRMKPSQDILTFRLLCHDERVGGVIGKGGQIIKTLQMDTGCEIKVTEGVPDSEDRVIIVSGPAHPDERISAVQDAVLRVQNRIMRALPDNKDQTVMARLLVSSNQIGCLLGKGGSIIAEMRKLSRAHIRILGKDQIPKCASEDEEVVLINGEFEAVQDALLQITSRLRHHFFRDMFPSINYPPNPAFLDQPPFPSYLGRRELSPPGMYPNYGPPFHKFDGVGGLPPHGGFHPRDERAPFMHNMHRFGGPRHLSERKPWGPQGLLEGGGPMGLQEYGGNPQRRIAGFGGGNQPAIITSTTVEVVVPRSIVPVIYGEDGECLKQIREISDAKITITEPKPGAAETVIIISGTPEQTHAAQSLIQAFVISEAEST
ncbi:hypothetical protein FEM48_Zijuj06G0161200 [Ziziphus jujuba var. spinosa]|uniref:K Homology domain-containing protein n=1 Tax=Ziziphus jujuba var. spinosa TaxID=714518 RepID=A0A978VAA0_ZIZJJ|nr:hypothetical protein FEM48_Zijuj06G0161200 [Ziziphus jujuba var. spinosa]